MPAHTTMYAHTRSGASALRDSISPAPRPPENMIISATSVTSSGPTANGVGQGGGDGDGDGDGDSDVGGDADGNASAAGGSAAESDSPASGGCGCDVPGRGAPRTSLTVLTIGLVLAALILRDGQVVADQIALGISRLRKQHLVRVGDQYVVSIDDKGLGVTSGSHLAQRALGPRAAR